MDKDMKKHAIISKPINYFLATKSGAYYGMIRENLFEIPNESLNYSLNYSEMW